MISKAIHQFWHNRQKGNSIDYRSCNRVSPYDMPDNEQIWCNSHRVNNPNWSYILWDMPTLMTNFGGDQKFNECVEAANTTSELSDICRWYVLNKFGGVYLDTDMESFKPLDPLTEFKDFIACLYDNNNTALSFPIPCFVGSSAKHPATSLAIKLLHERKDIKEPSGSKYGVILDLIWHNRSYDHVENNMAMYPSHIAFAYPLNEPKNMLDPNERVGSYLAHHWNGSWVAEGDMTPPPPAPDQTPDQTPAPDPRWL